MNRVIVAVAILLLAFTSLAVAADMPGTVNHKSIGIGFHRVAAPLGMRWWLSGQKIGIDLGLGYSSTPAEFHADESVTGWSFEGGVPFVAHSWDRVHLILRPGFLYSNQEVDTGPGLPFDTRNETNLAITGELEAEVFLADNVSFSAANGIAWNSFDPDIAGVDSQSSFGTIGNNFTTIGFHIYFLGSDQ